MTFENHKNKQIKNKSGIYLDNKSQIKTEQVDQSVAIRNILAQKIGQTHDLPDEVLKTFINAESVQVNQRVDDDSAYTNKFKKISNQMSESQIEFLKNQIIDKNQDIQKRIICIYLLINNNSVHAADNLFNVLAQHQKFISHQEFKPHTLGELLAGQNAAIYNMIAEEWMNRQIIVRPITRQSVVDLIQVTSDLKLRLFLKARSDHL